VKDAILSEALLRIYIFFNNLPLIISEIGDDTCSAENSAAVKRDIATKHHFPYT